MTSKRATLASPIRVGHLTLKHRIIMGPMGNWLWHPDGKPKPEAADTLVARVQGGAAMVMVGAGQPHPGYENGWKPGFWQDENIAPLRVLTDAVHAAGAPIVAQLQHDGSSAKPPVSPSGIPCITISSGGKQVDSRALDTDEVAEMAQQFVAASHRAQQAGFDGVELAGQAGYLLGQFLSPRLNQRADRYGGDAERRRALALEIVRGVRARCGTRFVIGYALTVDELQPGGMVPADCVPIAQALEAAGIDYLDVRVGTHETFAFSERAVGHNRYQSRDGVFHHAALLKRALRIPVFAVTHGAYEPAQWEAALVAGEADVIQVGKAWLAEPQLAAKALAGADAAIRPCTLCMFCLDMGYVRGPTGTRSHCAINFELGQEAAQAVRKAMQPRRVLVVGSGPAGLECARIAAARGHAVTVWEVSAVPGGCLRAIAQGPGGDRFGRLADWLVQSCRDAGAQFECGHVASAATLAAVDADVVVNATGAAWFGGDASVVSAIARGNATGNDVLILGGSAAGVQVALTLGAQERRGITLYEPDSDALLRGISRLERNYVESVLLPKHQVRVVIQDPRPDCAGAVIDARPAARDQSAFTALASRGIGVHVIGDARQQRSVGDALHEGARLGREL